MGDSVTGLYSLTHSRVITQSSLTHSPSPDSTSCTLSVTILVPRFVLIRARSECSSRSEELGSATRARNPPPWEPGSDGWGAPHLAGVGTPHLAVFSRSLSRANTSFPASDVLSEPHRRMSGRSRLPGPGYAAIDASHDASGRVHDPSETLLSASRLLRKGA